MYKQASFPQDSAIPRPSRPWHQLWLRAITRPTAATFTDLLQEPDTSFRRALIWIVLAGVLGGFISIGISPGFFQIDPATRSFQYNIAVDLRVVVGIFTYLFEVLTIFVVAKVLGGQGSFSKISFLCACYTSPLLLLSGVISGFDAAILAVPAPITESGPQLYAYVQGFYSWYPVLWWLILLVRTGLNVLAIRTVYGFTIWKAALPPLIFVLVAVGFTLCLSIFTFEIQ